MKPKKTKSSRYSIELAVGPSVERLPVIIRKHPRSRRMIIRYQQLQHYVSLSLPRYVSIRQGLDFVEEKRAWLERQIRDCARQIPFTAGAVIPVMGKNLTVTHVGGRGVVATCGSKLLVPGDEQFVERRVREWIRAQAKETIAALAREKARAIGRRIKRISLRDTSSRWGSCSHDGCLSFSWRLVLAPPEILDYVVAHEVAHLKEHNHSPAFWAVVESLYPDYERACRWLKHHGARLYAYG